MSSNNDKHYKNLQRRLNPLKGIEDEIINNLGGMGVRTKIISEDDILNLTILLNSEIDFETFLSKV